MKIFNWVHRKFHHKEEKEIVNMVDNEIEKQELLKHVALANNSSVFDGWGDGILTIGTFGFHPPNLDNFITNPHEVLDNHGDKIYDREEKREAVKVYEGENEEISPLMYAEYGCHNLDIGTGSSDKNVEMGNNIMTIEITPGSEVGFNINLENEIILEDQEKKKKERVTLADLFSAEYDDGANTLLPDHMVGKLKTKHNEKLLVFDQVDGDDHNSKKKKKGTLSFAKKLIPAGSAGGDSDLRPIKKVQRMMQRMMKKKIHPNSIEEKSPKIRANDSVSLLPTREATV